MDANGLSVAVDAQNQLVATPDVNAPGDEWVFTDTGDGWFTIRSADSFGGLLADLGNVNWRLVDLGDGYVQIVSADGNCASTATLGQPAGPCNADDPAQRFHLVGIDPPPSE